MSASQNYTQILQTLLQADDERMRILRHVSYLALPDCWIGAGFVRSLVWDHGHGIKSRPPIGDVDVVWFDPQNGTEEADRLFEAQLAHRAPGILWSVKNQGRMHLANNDEPYTSTADAMRHWPETATAVGVRPGNSGIEVLAPFGLDDLFNLIVRPTPKFVGERQVVVVDRVNQKRWLERWPRLKLQLAVR